MAIRFYVVPKITAADGSLGPKYFCGGTTVNLIAGDWAAMDYGREEIMLVRADVTAGENTSISANADVITIPANIENAIGGGQTLNTVRNRLEALNIPGTWVTSTLTYRQLLRWVGRLFCILQRFNGRYRAKFFEGVTLATTMGQLTQTQRDRLRAAVQDFGLDTTQFAASSTVRDVLKALADVMPIAIVMHGETL
jgi:hypothetical protein